VVEGIGEDFVPSNCDLSLIRDAYSISDGESLSTARDLLRYEGILAGSSTGTLVAAALRYCRAQKVTKRVVTLACDSGNKYLSKLFNDQWMVDQGFTKREKYGDLRDVIARLHDARATITIGPNDSLSLAYARMKQNDVSQLPVLEGDRVVGIVDESDLLLATQSRRDAFTEPVSSAMTKAVETVTVDAPVGALSAIFDRGRVAVVVDGERFLGLITRIDLLNYLRNQSA
jgi:cystathionine beta-synthase